MAHIEAAKERQLDPLGVYMRELNFIEGFTYDKSAALFRRIEETRKCVLTEALKFPDVRLEFLAIVQEANEKLWSNKLEFSPEGTRPRLTELSSSLPEIQRGVNLLQSEVSPTETDDIHLRRTIAELLWRYRIKDQIVGSQLKQIAPATTTRADATRGADDVATLFAELENLKGQVTTGNMRLVFAPAKRWHHISGEDLQELIQRGNLGLMRAVARFEVSKGFSFATYSSSLIAKAVKGQSEGNFALEGISRRIKASGIIASVQVAQECIRESGGDCNEPEAVVAELQRTKGPTAPTAHDVRAVLAYSAPRHGSLPLEQIPDRRASSPDEYMIRGEIVEQLLEALPQLPPREQFVLSARFGLFGQPTKTLEQIATDDLEVTKERVRQIEALALKRLKLKLINSGQISNLLENAT